LKSESGEKLSVPKGNSGRFTRHRWRVDVYVDFLGLTPAARELTTEKEKEHGGNDDHKNHKYGYHCRAAATAIIVSHKIDLLLYALRIRFSLAI
jgi:hypothetical protein